MKKEELRIGNFIEQGKVFEVKPYHVRVSYWHQHKQQDAMSLVKLDECDPIPLSEEVLLKCSLCVYDELDGEYRINDTRYSIHKVTNFDGFLLCDGNNVLVELKHLHQLQNLYYALTGEELEVSL